MWSAGAPTRLTVTTSGIYVVTIAFLAQVTVATSTSQTLTLRYNGANIAEVTNAMSIGVNGFPTMAFSAVYLATAGGYFDSAYTFTGGTHTLLADGRSTFSAVRIGQSS